MRIIAISDTHGFHGKVPKLPEADIFIHAGDFMNGGRSFEEIKSFNTWLDKVPVHPANRLIGFGNHDCLFDETHLYSNKDIAARARNTLTNGVYFQDEYVHLRGVKMYFSPWTQEFYGWGFNAKRGEAIAKIWAKIPEDTEVLVTHGPPYDILDKAFENSKWNSSVIQNPSIPLGCEELLKVVKRLPNLKYHIFGHIHGSRGQKIVRFEHGKAIDPVFVNAAFLDEQYKPHPGPGYFLLEI
jgi:Icc-related predicted phosphoesterase